MSFVRDGDLRYVGQGYELKIPFPVGVIGKRELEEIWKRFHEAHEREYGHAFPTNPIEIVNVRVIGVGQMPKITKLAAPKGATLDKARVRTIVTATHTQEELQFALDAFARVGQDLRIIG